MSGKLLEGKNALITGAGKNIGSHIAIEMAKQGANIFFTDIDKKQGRNLESHLSKICVATKWFHSDISKTEDIEELREVLNKETYYIDILVNNVGIQEFPSPIRDISKEEFPRLFGTNVFGPIYLTKIFSQMMIKSGTPGSILFITSIHQDTLAGSASYSSSKAALTMVIKELAMELAPFQIRVNGIRPGGVWEDDEGNPRPFKQSPLHGTTINPSYIGRGAVYLASDYFSKFTTGTILTIDGGLSLHSYLTL